MTSNDIVNLTVDETLRVGQNQYEGLLKLLWLGRHALLNKRDERLLEKFTSFLWLLIEAHEARYSMGIPPYPTP